MIGKLKYSGKMLQYLLIFGLFFSAIHADGKFAILQAPGSIEFQGEEPIQDKDVGEVILGSTGSGVSSDVKWAGLYVTDPFHLPKHIVVASIEGASIDIQPVQYEVPLAGTASGVDDSLDVMVAELKNSKISTCNINYSSKHASKSSHKCFGHAVPPKEDPILPVTKSLKSDDVAAKKFLSSIADLNDAVDNYLKLKETKNVELKSVIVVRLSLASIVQAYGADSAEQAEAVELVKKTIAKLQKTTGDGLVVAVSSTNNSKSRSKRQAAQETNKKNPYNIAKFYSSDYPVIFNIIFWFMVVFGLSLLAISYAIGSMDPGKDSIIYRMTSTRMKKDN